MVLERELGLVVDLLVTWIMVLERELGLVVNLLVGLWFLIDSIGC